MNSYDGAELCELVALYLLYKLSCELGKEQNGLYRDDGLSFLQNLSGPQAEQIKKKICKIFQDCNLKITIETNLKIVDFLDVTFNLTNGKYYPYQKPNSDPLYINALSTHPNTIIKEIPKMISKRISEISCDENEFEKVRVDYEHTLIKSGFNEKLCYNENNTTKRNRNRKRKIIWFYPPFSSHVKTNIEKIFMSLINKHFPKHHRYHKIFNTL